MVVTFAAVMVPDVFPAWFGVQSVAVTNQNVRHYVAPKTLWDWFGLIAIPLSIVVVGYVLNRADRSHERRLQDQRSEETRKIEAQRIAESRSVEEHRIREGRELEAQRIAENQKIEQERTQDTIVSNYLDQMTDLLLNHSLRISAEGAEVRSVARARTLTALRLVDGERRSTIVQFLYESRLIGYFNGEGVVDAVVHLGQANLAETNLSRTRLSGANLRGASLIGADLSGANLRGASLIGADLSGANLTRAWLKGTYFEGADLRGVTLDGAKLAYCVGLTLGRLLQAQSLHGVILPNHIDPADLGDLWSPPKPENTPEPQP